VAQPIQIRPFASGDADAVAKLLVQLGYPSMPGDVTARIERMASEVGHQILVAEIAGSVVGVVTVYVRHLLSVDAPLGRIAAMVVDDARRSQGVGSKLVQAAEAIARDAGCNRMEVTSAERRTRAHAFYRRLGYEVRPLRFIKHL
jgi:GNAT superfamily N-acetyltransferase